MKETQMYIITKITDLKGNDRKDGRYPLRINRRFTFGLGEPMLGCKMSICYRPYRNQDYKGTLRTSIVTKIQVEEDQLIVTTENSIYYFTVLPAEF